MRALSQPRCDGEGSVFYTDRKRREIQKGSSLHSSAYEILCLDRSHFVQVPWDLCFIAFDIRFSSSRFLISAWIVSHLFLALKTH